MGSSIQDNINNFKNKYPSAEVKLFNSSNEEITEGIISTGNKISIKVNGIEKKYDIVVYGDTNGDLTMFKHTGNPYAINPTKELLFNLI